MIVRLSDVLAPSLGLPKDKLGKVLRVVLHEQDQKRLDALPAGYQLFVPDFMAKRYLAQMQNFKRSPLSQHIFRMPRRRAVAERLLRRLMSS